MLYKFFSGSVAQSIYKKTKSLTQQHNQWSSRDCAILAGLAIIMRSAPSRKLSPLSKPPCVMSSLSHTHIAGQRQEPSVPSSMTSLFGISSCLRIYLEQQRSCQISYRPPILTSLRQRIWPSLYLMLYQESAQTLSGKKSNNKQRLCVQTQAQHILHARKGRPRKLDT